MSRRSGSLPAGTVLGRYVIETFIGAGGLGEVYAAHDPQLSRRVALKIITPERATDPARDLR